MNSKNINNSFICSLQLAQHEKTANPQRSLSSEFELYQLIMY